MVDCVVASVVGKVVAWVVGAVVAMVGRVVGGVLGILAGTTTAGEECCGKDNCQCQKNILFHFTTSK